MASTTTAPQTRTNRLRGLELSIESRHPLDTTEAILARAEAFAGYIHTGTTTETTK